MHSQQQLLDIALSFGAVVQVDEKSLQSTLQELIENKNTRVVMGKKGLTMMATLCGATERTIAIGRTLTPHFFSSACVK